MGFKHRTSIYGADHRTIPYWSRQAIILNHIAPITITGDGKTDAEWRPSRSRKNRYSNLKNSKTQARCVLRHSLQNLAFHMQKKRRFHRIEELAPRAFSTIYYNSNNHQSPKCMTRRKALQVRLLYWDNQVPQKRHCATKLLQEDED